jgi:hypothetical protein
MRRLLAGRRFSVFCARPVLAHWQYFRSEFDHRSEFYYMVLSIANDIMYRAYVFSARSIRSSRLDPSSVSTHVHREHSRLIILIVYLQKVSQSGESLVRTWDRAHIQCLILPCHPSVWNALQLVLHVSASL